MAVYFAVGTPTQDGRIQDFRMVPPPASNVGEQQVLVWDDSTSSPIWKKVSDLGIVSAVSPFAFLTTDTGQFLTTDTGARLVARIS